MCKKRLVVCGCLCKRKDFTVITRVTTAVTTTGNTQSLFGKISSIESTIDNVVKGFDAKSPDCLRNAQMSFEDEISKKLQRRAIRSGMLIIREKRLARTKTYEMSYPKVDHTLRQALRTCSRVSTKILCWMLVR